MKNKTNGSTKNTYNRYKGPLVRNFVPRGRSGMCIYAVTVKDHPEKVKIGMSSRWKTRRREYENWNLADGDGILEERVFTITDEFVDLRALESHILDRITLNQAARREWFVGSVDDAGRMIDRILCEHEISYLL